MLKYVVFFIFLCEINNGISSNVDQEQSIESSDVFKNGIKKNKVGANGLEVNWDKITRNFQNPVLEYLLQQNPNRAIGPPQRGVVREIRHSQTLLIPNFLTASLPKFFTNQLPQFESVNKKPMEEVTRNPDRSPYENFWNFLKNKTQPGGSNIQESVVSSPVLHLNKNHDETKDTLPSVLTYPAIAVVINTFNKDGSLKNSITHFQPDFNLLRPTTNEKSAEINEEKRTNKNYNNIYNNQHVFSNYVRNNQNSFLEGHGHLQQFPQRISWPFANYFPIVINDPFLSVYNAFATSMYNAVTSMVEYGPEADVCLKNKDNESEKVNRETANNNPKQKDVNGEKILPYIDLYRKEADEIKEDVFGEVVMQSGSFKRNNEKTVTNEKENSRSLGFIERQRRDTTSVFVKSREGDIVDIAIEEPNGSNNYQKMAEGSNLVLRKGGISIAGPGGAATAYTGGTAIVGPYGTVYKSPEGMAILGPFSKVVNITDDTSFEDVLKMHKAMQSQNEQLPFTKQESKDAGGFKNFRNYFSYKTNLPVKFEVKPSSRSFSRNQPKIARLKEEGIVKAIEEIRNTEFRKITEDASFEEKTANTNETILIFRPKSKAEAGRNGIAFSAPTSHAILYPGQRANIYFEPESVASAGPSGFAHAQSDLFVSYVQNTSKIELEQEVLRKNAKPNFETDVGVNSPDERARSFSQVLVNTPPLSTILKPPQQESRQFLGYTDKKRKTKPSKPYKEEGSSEEVGEEHEEESTSQSQENANEAVAISPPPEGASVAEAKPIGLAIAGPGGVAASKPQGTAVAGPGGLAIARPVGTAIAGVEVEGSVPIGGQQKHKKKPKQEQEKTEAELHYVGGLTGPIGNPQPKEFADSIYYRTVKEAKENNLQDNFFSQGGPHTKTFQIYLGQQNGKYGFIPMSINPVEGEARLQKKTDFPTFFHGLLGNNAQAYHQFPNYQTQF